MKNLYKLFGIIALVAVIGFSMAACDNGSPGPGPGPGPGPTDPEPVFSVSGKFDKGGGNEVFFKLADAATYSRAARAVSDAYAVTGELVDDDFTIRLSGTYDPTDRTYTASASANSLGIRYTINGAYDSSGNSAGSTASVTVKDPQTGEWTAATYVIDEAAAVTITGEAVESEPGGIPAFARGNWYAGEEGVDEDGIRWAYSGKALVSQWNIIVDISDTYGDQTAYDSITSSVVEVEDKGGGKYVVILAYPVYEPTSADQVAAAIADFFSGKGVTPTKIEDWESILQSPCYLIEEENYGNNITWFNFNDWNVVNQFYNTNHLVKYLIGQNVTPVTRYEKDEFQFTRNNTVLEWKQYGTMVEIPDPLGGTYEYLDSVFETLVDARAATLLSEDPMTLTRNP